MGSDRIAGRSLPESADEPQRFGRQSAVPPPDAVPAQQSRHAQKWQPGHLDHRSVERLVRRHGSIYRRHSASTSILVRAVGFPSAVGSSATGAEHFDQCLPDGELAGHDVDSVRRLHGIRLSHVRYLRLEKQQGGATNARIHRREIKCSRLSDFLQQISWMLTSMTDYKYTFFLHQ